MKFACMLIALVASTCSVSAFVPCPASLARPPHHFEIASSAVRAPAGRGTSNAVRMGWGDALGKAFANEEMGASSNPGLKNAPKTCMVTVNGKKIQAVQGQRLRDVILAAKAKVEYGCEKGNCGTCESMVDGKKTRVCKAIVPRNKSTLTIKTKLG